MKGDGSVKIVSASTEEQEEHIQNLIETMFTVTFPKFFSDETIHSIAERTILKKSDLFYNGTMEEALKIISSLQTLIVLLELKAAGKEQKHFQELFERNCKILRNFGICFPFSFDQFPTGGDRKEKLSRYTKPANKWMI